MNGAYGFPGVATLPPPVPGQAQAGMQLPKTIVRVGEQSIWSTYQHADAAAVAGGTFRVFTTPMGSVGQGFGAALSIAETNLQEANRVPSGQAYDVYGVALQAYYSDQFPTVGADLRNVVNNLVLVWKFLQSEVEIAPAMLIGAGGGIFGDTADTGAAEGGSGGSRINLNNGNGQVWVYRQYPVMLSANATFSISQKFGDSATVIDGGSNDSSLNLRVCLLGQYKVAIAAG